jgi:hypothetical protein
MRLYKGGESATVSNKNPLLVFNHLRYAISTLLLYQPSIEHPIPGRDLRYVVEDIAEATNPYITIP